MAESASNDQPLGARELLSFGLRFALGLLFILLAVGSLSYLARDEAQKLARSFVETFGYWGMALGTLLADGIHFPVPPQFYMLLAVASGASTLYAFGAIATASLVAGYAGYRLAELASRAQWLSRKTQQPRELLQRAFLRFGYRAALVASILPIPYSMLCYLAGLNRMPHRFLALLALCRIPKLIGFYYLVYLGWKLA